MSAYIAGLSLGLSLILAIGAQNAFVLRQGLRREHLFAVCFICACSDAVLICVGVWGFTAIVAFSPMIEPAARYGGALFLLYYGALSAYSAWRARHALQPAERGAGSRLAVLSTCLALTWLNPHVYLDTVILLGAVSTQFPGAQTQFALGAVCASFGFFYCLGYGARLLTPVFALPSAWRLLDLAVALLMWWLAWGLLRPLIGA